MSLDLQKDVFIVLPWALVLMIPIKCLMHSSQIFSDHLFMAHLFNYTGVLLVDWCITDVILTVLQKEVGRYEPWLALDGGVGLGLDSLIPICSGAATILQPGGFLALETTGTADSCFSECSHAFVKVQTAQFEQMLNEAANICTGS